MREVKICHLYPDVLNLYGDRGNILCMRRRLEWRGVDVTVASAGVGEKAELAGCDVLFIGGGQDFEQEILLEDLRGGKDREIRAAIEDGVTVLAICAGYQVLGRFYQTHEGVKCDFLGALDLYTVGARERMIGNCLFTCTPENGGFSVVGFENHSGRTYLGDGVKPLGTVVAGFGNNGEDGSEGAHYKNVFASYSHGPLLPKNPGLCDFILQTALERKYGGSETLAPLDDGAEELAHEEMARRLRGEGAR